MKKTFYTTLFTHTMRVVVLGLMLLLGINTSTFAVAYYSGPSSTLVNGTNACLNWGTSPAGPFTTNFTASSSHTITVQTATVVLATGTSITLGDITIEGTGELNIGCTTLNCAGNFLSTGAGILSNASGNTVRITMNTDGKTIGGTTTGSGGFSIGNSTAANLTIKLSANTAIGGRIAVGNSALTAYNNTLDLNGFNLAVDNIIVYLATAATAPNNTLNNKVKATGVETLTVAAPSSSSTIYFDLSTPETTNKLAVLNQNGASGITLATSVTIGTTLRLQGGGNVTVGSGTTLTMADNSTIIRSAGSITATGTLAFGSLVNVTINASLSNGNELPSAAPTAMSSIGTLTIASGVTYTITGGRAVTNLVNNNIVALVPGTTMTLTINGNISGSGTITGHANASISIGGTTGGNAGTLNFTSGSQIANNLTINRTGANASVTLGTPVTLNAATGNLTLTSGQIILGSNDLTTTLITGGSATAYVVTNGTGVLISPTTAATLKLFPIGTATTYDPVEVTPTNGVNFSAKVSASAPSGVSDNTKMAAREWNVSAMGAGSTVMSLTNGGTVYTPTTASMGHYKTDNTWEEFTGTTYAANKWTATNASGSFSPFGGGERGAFNATVLAVELTNFQAKATQKAALLTWTTASEKDNAYFNIEHSTNGTAFETIGQVKGNGTKNAATTYNFEHPTPSVSVNYYRLKQVDADGKATYSAVRSVVFGKSSLVVKATLVQEALDIVVSDTEKDPLSIFNLSGQNVMTVKVQGTQRVNVSALPAGMYIIRVGTTGEAVRFVKE